MNFQNTTPPTSTIVLVDQTNSKQIALDIEIKEEIDEDIPNSAAKRKDRPFLLDENTTEFLGFDPESIIKIEDDSLDALEFQSNFLFVNCQFNRSKIDDSTNCMVKNESSVCEKVELKSNEFTGGASTSMIIDLPTHRVVETISRQQIALDIEIKVEEKEEDIDAPNVELVNKPNSDELFDESEIVQLINECTHVKPIVAKLPDEQPVNQPVVETAVECQKDAVIGVAEAIVVNEPSACRSKPDFNLNQKSINISTNDTYLSSAIEDNPPIDSICMTCDKEYVYRRTSDLLVHMETVHDCNLILKKTHICPICKLAKATAFSLKRHVMAVHNKSRHLKCDFCEKRFSYPESLANHRRLHTCERPYICEICGKNFVTFPALSVSTIQNVCLYFHTKSI